MIELFTAATPNGWKISVALEELGLPYSVRPIALGKLEQKEDLVPRDQPERPRPRDHRSRQWRLRGVRVRRHSHLPRGEDRQLLPEDPKARSRVLQWLMFQMGGIGPMMGQANVFFRYAPEKIQYAIDRYQRETRRLFEVLERQLEHHPYIANDEYSIADIACTAGSPDTSGPGVSIDGLPGVRRWLDLIGARPAVQKGRSIPPSPSAEERAKSRGISEEDAGLAGTSSVRWRIGRRAREVQHLDALLARFLVRRRQRPDLAVLEVAPLRWIDPVLDRQRPQSELLRARHLLHVAELRILHVATYAQA
jgi:GST-like protein